MSVGRIGGFGVRAGRGLVSCLILVLGLLLTGVASAQGLQSLQAGQEPGLMAVQGLSAPQSGAFPSLFNLSTRARVRAGDAILIGGFVVRGEAPKRVLIRARGPSLAAAGVANAMADPTLRLFSGATEVGYNDNWRDSQEAEIQATGRAPGYDAEAALIATLAPGPYTVHIAAADGQTGVAIFEVIGIDEEPDIRLFNISTRAQVETGDDVAIGGFVIRGDTPKQVLLRGRGPTLAGLPAEAVLSDPTLELFSGGSAIAFNDDWQSSANAAAIAATGRAPNDAREAALLVTLEPGPYTAILRGAGGATGIGIVEVIGVDDATTVPESVSVALDPGLLDGFELVTFYQGSLGIADVAEVRVPVDTSSVLFLTDSEERLAGIGISQGQGLATVIDAHSTALGLVYLTPVGWMDFDITINDLADRVSSLTSFSELISLVGTRQQLDPAGLLEDEQILGKVIQVATEVLELVRTDMDSAMEALASGPAGEAQSDSPWLEFGNTLRNPRFVPYGVWAVDGAGVRNTAWPYLVRERQYGWAVALPPIHPGDAPSAGFPGLVDGKLCAVRFDPRANPFESLMTVIPGVGPIAVTTWSILSNSLHGMSEDQRIYREAQLNGMMAWHNSLYLNVVKSIPGVGIIGTAGDLIRNTVENDGLIEAVYGQGVGPGVGALYDYVYASREEAGAIARRIAHVVVKDGRQTKAIAQGFKSAAALLNAPQYFTDLAFFLDTLVAPHGACFLIDGNNGIPFDPGVAPIVLNDTGIFWSGHATSGNAATCDPAHPAGQDCHYGRDALAAAGTLTKVGGGSAGFDYTKIANNGSVLPASATLGSGPSDWACTRDNVTGLIWEVKVNNSAHLRHNVHTYTWYSTSSPDGNPGSVGSTSTCSNTLGGQNCNTQNYAAAVNTQGLCGSSDWRMPTRRELQGIVDYGRSNPAIDTGYFPNTPSSVFWSGSPSAFNSSGAWYVDFSGGSGYSYRSYGSRVRLVRGGQ